MALERMAWKEGREEVNSRDNAGHLMLASRGIDWAREASHLGIGPWWEVV